MAEDEETTRALELTGPRDTLPDDPSGSVAHPDFPLDRRGYDRAAVDAYVHRVVKLVGELETVRSPRAAVRQALERVGTETAGILAQAHAAADAVTAAARTEAEELTTSSRRAAEDRLERARAEAEEIVRDARDRAQTLDRDADVIWQERGRLLADVDRVAGELQRVVRAGEERFPPETEALEELPEEDETTEEFPAEGETTEELPPS